MTSCRSVFTWSRGTSDPMLRVSAPVVNGCMNVGLSPLVHPASVILAFCGTQVDIQQVGRKGQGSQDVIGHTGTRVAQDLHVPIFSPRIAGGSTRGIHAGDDGQPAGRSASQPLPGPGRWPRTPALASGRPRTSVGATGSDAKGSYPARIVGACGPPLGCPAVHCAVSPGGGQEDPCADR